MKKDQDQSSGPYPSINGESAGGTSPREVAAMAKYQWTDEVPSFMYHEDIRKVDLHYNL